MNIVHSGTVHGPSRLTDHDVYLFREGKHYRLFDKLGAHLHELDDGTQGTLFAVWAPNATAVSVVGDFNGWSSIAHPLAPRWDGSGIWEGFIAQVGKGALYKYYIVSPARRLGVAKGDPFALMWECPPKTASIVWDLDYSWKDGGWLDSRARTDRRRSPQAVYEVHLGSWRRRPEEGNRSLSYAELSQALVEYVHDMGFTHVEFLPVSEHPFFGSWGYQTTGYFAPTSRFGNPQDFMRLVDRLHQEGIGVILDWVPSHFTTDEHGLSKYDGSSLFEHEDPRLGFHPDWGSYIFNYGRFEVRAFLISSALFWLEKYHIDGLRVDAVASMLYLDYSREEGQWIPNRHGGKENLEAISFLRELNGAVRSFHPSAETIAEESTSWAMVSQPSDKGGLGFDMKWKMGWMHDTLSYFSENPINRKHHHDKITFSMWYAYSENFMLPLSHDEAVHGKGSLMGKMAGDDWQKRANLRLLYGYMYSHPGKKLLFMGSEFAQWAEWNHDSSLDWHLLNYDSHRQISAWVRDLNRIYREQPGLHERDFEPEGFQWVDVEDHDHSVVSYLRRGLDPEKDEILIVCNFTPMPRHRYPVGVPRPGSWREILNSDAAEYGGSGLTNPPMASKEQPVQGWDDSILADLPPLGVLFLMRTPRGAPAADGVHAPRQPTSPADDRNERASNARSRLAPRSQAKAPRSKRASAAKSQKRKPKPPRSAGPDESPDSA